MKILIILAAFLILTCPLLADNSARISDIEKQQAQIQQAIQQAEVVLIKLQGAKEELQAQEDSRKKAMEGAMKR